MKRHGNLFDRIASFESLLQAAERAYRGKRRRPVPADFHFHLERNLFQLQEELLSGSYRPGRYRSFWIYDPKNRGQGVAHELDRPFEAWRHLGPARALAGRRRVLPWGEWCGPGEEAPPWVR